jgi:uncharacterized protein (TIGR02391 family)
MINCGSIPHLPQGTFPWGHSSGGRDDPRVDAAAQNFSDAVLGIYGPNSPEYRRFQYHRIGHGSMHVGMDDDELQERFAEGVTHTIGALKNLITRLEERRADFGADSVSRVRAAFDGLALHPRIAAVCVDLYRDGHYRNAVLDASVALVNLVKERSRRHDLDGARLMSAMYSRNNPILAFNGRADQTDEDEQEGMMHLFMGAVLALRNPRAHALLDDSPELALEYVALISLLGKRVEQARRPTA